MKEVDIFIERCLGNICMYILNQTTPSNRRLPKAKLQLSKRRPLIVAATPNGAWGRALL